MTKRGSDSVCEAELGTSLRGDIDRATVAGLFAKRVKMPWEAHPFCAVFNPASFMQPSISFESCSVGFLDRAAAADVPTMSRTSLDNASIGKHAAQRKLVAAKILTHDDMRHRSLLLFRIILESESQATRLGTQLALCKTNNQEELYWSTLEDTFASKSSATLYKRSRSLWLYFLWLKSLCSRLGIEFSEELVYGYLVQARRDGKAPTHGQAFTQCLNFVHATCEMTSFDPTHLSGRVKGIVKSMANNKRPLQQARALYKEEVMALEDFVLDFSHHPCIRIIAGYLLFCFVACCRFSDPMYAMDWQISASGNIVLIEARTRVHKTAHVRNRQSVFLPLVGLGRVFRVESWAKVWANLRRDYLGQARSFVLPAFSEQTSEWVNRAMIASEGALWLRDIVATYRITGSSLTTHGLKATLLTWVTISGTLSFDQRRALGHHVDPGSRAPLTYSRDNAIGLQVPP